MFIEVLDYKCYYLRAKRIINIFFYGQATNKVSVDDRYG